MGAAIGRYTTAPVSIHASVLLSYCYCCCWCCCLLLWVGVPADALASRAPDRLTHWAHVTAYPSSRRAVTGCWCCFIVLPVLGHLVCVCVCVCVEIEAPINEQQTPVVLQ